MTGSFRDPSSKAKRRCHLRVQRVYTILLTLLLIFYLDVGFL